MELLSCRDIAALTGFSVRTVQRRLEEVESVTKGKEKMYIPSVVLKEFVERSTTNKQDLQSQNLESKIYLANQRALKLEYENKRVAKEIHYTKECQAVQIAAWKLVFDVLNTLPNRMARQMGDSPKERKAETQKIVEELREELYALSELPEDIDNSVLPERSI